MSEHLSPECLDRYRRRVMSPAELLDADDHIAACEPCRLEGGGSEALSTAFVSLRSDLARTYVAAEHLAYEQLAGFVDGTLDDVAREIVQSHLDACSGCADDARDLQTVARSRESSSANVVAFRSRSRMRIAFWAAAAATVVAFSVWIALQPSRRQAAEPEARVDERPHGQTDSGGRTGSEVPNVNAERAGGENRASGPGTDGTGSRAYAPVSLADGNGHITIDEHGQLSGLEGLSAADSGAVRDALATLRVETPAVVGHLAGSAGQLMGVPGDGVSFPLEGPVGTVTLGDRPTFRWRALAGASGYRVAILDANLRPVATSPVVAQTEWTLGSQLARDTAYVWQVTALVGGREIVSPAPPAPEARFRVIGRAQASSLERALSANPGSHLVAGVLYAREGLLDDAEREFQSLVSANPDSPAARALLASVRALRKR